MNYKLVGKILGKIMILEGILMLAPLAVSLVYRESVTHVLAFLIPILLLTVIGLLLQIPKPRRNNLYQKEGFALTAMYGNFTTDGPDVAEGDMDTYYVSAFARACSGAWTHTFVATIGRMDGSIERTVNYGAGAYTTEASVDGMGFGLMYEVGRVYALDEERGEPVRGYGDAGPRCPLADRGG